MKENFDSVLAHVLKSEGGWSDNPADPGGATMKGITFEVFKTFKRNTHLTKDDLKNISDQDVHDIYKTLYWDKVHGDELPNGIDYATFDAAVNMGVGRASKLLQKSVGVTADGVIGQGTLQAVKETNSETILNAFTEEKELFYKSLPTFGTFGKGWMNRVAEVKTIATSMIA
jgi:lysozyme family protein